MDSGPLRSAPSCLPYGKTDRHVFLLPRAPLSPHTTHFVPGGMWGDRGIPQELRQSLAFVGFSPALGVQQLFWRCLCAAALPWRGVQVLTGRVPCSVLCSLPTSTVHDTEPRPAHAAWGCTRLCGGHPQPLWTRDAGGQVGEAVTSWTHASPVCLCLCFGVSGGHFSFGEVSLGLSSDATRP